MKNLTFSFWTTGHARFPGVPVAGGGAALGAGQTCSELLPAAPGCAACSSRRCRSLREVWSVSCSAN